ncbi:MAG TPA: ATP-binding cassette domain-containing protein [Candidatus Latescibacteria bacterium]|jgi:ATPase subunit of ABC transporter with duplicated ATPase domains|nr:ABC transporter ATP-binding protein [Gemmatimonadaceae bacterium]HJP33584.1 ATP-binding cassette domain-containing protein [Candidatus Latescibacterota bacterium]
MNGSDILFHDVGFTYDGAVTPLLCGANAHFSMGWSGIVGANGAGKTTLMRLATGSLVPTEGRIEITEGAVYCAQRTDDAPRDLEGLLADMDGEAWAIRGRLGIDESWPDRWDSLSHGERKRAQIGVALWQQPPALAIDEPTNHLDREARGMLVEALRRYAGVGLLVSHDRELLDGLCRQCAFVEPPEVTMRPGGYAKGVEQGQLERETALRDRDTATREMKKLEREVARRRVEASRSHIKRSKKGLGKGDNDERFKRNLARATGKDSQDGRLLNQLGGRAQQARTIRDEIQVKKEHDLGIWVAGERSHRDRLLWRPAGTIPVGGGRVLHHPVLAMRPADRIALTGPNGGGKSTLLRALLGDGLNVADGRIVYVPQEIDSGRSRQLLTAARSLPGDELGRLMTVVSCLNSRPARLLESEMPSPGEVRKLLLAQGIVRKPHLIVMDEPTNHMDLPSIECLEQALKDCPCGLLLVSHDESFLQNLATTRWELSWVDGAGGDAELAVREQAII